MGNHGFLVWNPSASHPRVVHDTFESAQREAERLADQHRGQRFYVLAPLGYFEHPAPRPVWRECDDPRIPF